VKVKLKYRSRVTLIKYFGCYETQVMKRRLAKTHWNNEPTLYAFPMPTDTTSYLFESTLLLKRNGFSKAKEDLKYKM